MTIGTIAVAVIFIWFVWNKLKNQTPQSGTETNRSSENRFPQNMVPNDKLVIVEGPNESEVIEILQEFCDMYNEESIQALPRLIKLAESKFAITFPYNIKFEIFCYFINFLNYPMGFNGTVKSTGWSTTSAKDKWITKQSANKNVMLYVSDHDTEYDNVFMTTSDNIGYKLGFAIGEEKQLLERPEKNYLRQPFSFTYIESKGFKDFK